MHTLEVPMCRRWGRWVQQAALERRVVRISSCCAQLRRWAQARLMEEGWVET